MATAFWLPADVKAADRKSDLLSLAFHSVRGLASPLAVPANWRALRADDAQKGFGFA
jgi:hypothetical protein